MYNHVDYATYGRIGAVRAFKGSFYWLSHIAKYKGAEVKISRFKTDVRLISRSGHEDKNFTVYETMYLPAEQDSVYVMCIADEDYILLRVTPDDVLTGDIAMIPQYPHVRPFRT